MTEWKEVSEAEMRDFIASYPRKLHFDTCFIMTDISKEDAK